jgi:hypothetical protein
MTQVDLTEAAIDTTLSDTRSVSRNRSTFYFGMAIAMSVTVFIGFGPSFYLNAYFAEAVGRPPLQALPAIVIVHGIVLTMWMIVLMIQTGLVVGGQVRWHRRLGIAGAVLAAAVVVVGIEAHIASVRRDLGAFDSVPFLRFVAFGGFLSMIAFAGLASAAIGWRRRPEIHKRLILIATIVLLGAATARVSSIVQLALPALGPLPFFDIVLNDLFLVALLVHDWRTDKRLHGATLFGCLVVLGMQALNNSPLPHHPAVLQIVRWLAS